jgi:hypothetical protein
MDAVDMRNYAKEIAVLSKIGFTDYFGGTNLRIKDGKLFVFDTEKASFKESVHEKIDTYAVMHDNIYLSLKNEYAEVERSKKCG